MQSKQWDRLVLRHQTSDGRIKSKKILISTQPVQPIDRDPLAEAWLRQRDHTGQAPLPCKWNFPRLCEIEKAPHSWSTKSLAAFRAHVEGRPIFTIGKPIELAELAEQTSWLALLSRSRLVNRKEQVFWSHRLERSKKCGGIARFSWKTAMS